jgi:hypothetical protein
MTTIISRVYSTAAAAADATALLVRKGYAKADMHTFAGGAGEHAAAAMADMGVHAGAIRAVVGALPANGALVVAKAGFGQAKAISALLDGFDPLSGDSVYVQRTYDQPAAKTRYLPVLPDKPWLIFSDGFMPPAIMKNDKPSHAILLDHKPKATLMKDGLPFSNTSGIPALLKDYKPRAGLLAEPFPLSSLFRLPMLTRGWR